MKNSRATILIFIAVTLLHYLLYITKIIDPDFLFSLTAISVVIGYFITHQLVLDRKQKEKKRDVVLELIKGCHFFINEQNILEDKKKHHQLRDRFQDSYFQFSLVISKEAYRNLMDVTEAYHSLLEVDGKEGLTNFKNAQKRFVNKLRKEIFDEEEIDFGTYDFRIK